MPPIGNLSVHQEFEVSVEIVQTGNALSEPSQLGDVLRAAGHHGQPERLNGFWLHSNHHLDPRDVTIGEVVVDVFRFLDGVQEPDGSDTNAFSLLVLDDPELADLVEDADPVEELVIVPCGTSWPVLSQQLGRFDDSRMRVHC